MPSPAASSAITLSDAEKDQGGISAGPDPADTGTGLSYTVCGTCWTPNPKFAESIWYVDDTVPFTASGNEEPSEPSKERTVELQYRIGQAGLWSAVLRPSQASADVEGQAGSSGGKWSRLISHGRYTFHTTPDDRSTSTLDEANRARQIASCSDEELSTIFFWPDGTLTIVPPCPRPELAFRAKEGVNAFIAAIKSSLTSNSEGPTEGRS